jgi:hypothetical protein
MIKYNNKANGDRLDDAATVLLAAINRKDGRVIDILYFLTSVAGYRLISATTTKGKVKHRS